MPVSFVMNPAYGKWTVKETNWSENDSQHVNALLAKLPQAEPVTLKKLEEIHESLPA
jgi:hypothetical protein